MLALLARPLCRRPLFMTHHTYGKRKRLYTWLKRKSRVHYACLSKDMREYYGFDPERDPVDVLSSCCPEDLYPLATQRDASPPRPPLRLLGLGTIAYRKGWDVLLDALALLNSEDLERIQVDLYGVPRDPTYLQRLQDFLEIPFPGKILPRPSPGGHYSPPAPAKRLVCISLPQRAAWNRGHRGPGRGPPRDRIPKRRHSRIPSPRGKRVPFFRWGPRLAGGTAEKRGARSTPPPLPRGDLSECRGPLRPGRQRKLSPSLPETGA